WSFVEKRFVNSFNDVVDFVKMYIFDILFNNKYRHFINFLLLYKKDGTRDVVILDHELSFDKGADYSKITACMASLNRVASEDFKIFLKQSSVEFIDLFLFYYDLITVDFLESLLEEIEREDAIIMDKEKILSSYAETRKELAHIMDDVWGYVFFRELHAIDKQKIKKANKGKVQIGLRSYYVKKVTNRKAACELIGARLARVLDIPTPLYRVILIDGDYYIISEEIPNLVTGKEMQIEDNTLKGILAAWNSDGNKSDSLATRLVCMYLFDVLFLNGDRNNKNWGVGQNELYALDHEHLFCTYYPLRLTVETENMHDVYFDEEQAFADVCTEFGYFWDNASFVDRALFERMYNTVTPEVLRKIIEQIEVEGFTIADKFSIMDTYAKHYETLGFLLEERGSKLCREKNISKLVS
ncbi:MAG: hypothetical protein K2M17_00380, partial [Bacilli bacterium]|nr:hypothetical protein [Bacilli bacterium]